MTDQQRDAHLRLLSMLPVRKVGDFPENWPDKDRPLSAEELQFIEAEQEAA